MDRVIKMCLFYDHGEAATGDVPCFEKEEVDRVTEEKVIEKVADLLPEAERKELLGLLQEQKEFKTEGAKLVHLLDKMEALIQHNEALIHT